jgi:hypothetical protein
LVFASLVTAAPPSGAVANAAATQDVTCIWVFNTEARRWEYLCTYTPEPDVRGPIRSVQR